MINIDTQLILASNYKKQQAEKQLEIARQLGTAKGFYLYYFDLLSQMKGREKTFNEVNELYFNIFNEYRYSDYNSFRNALRNHLTSKKK